MAITYLGNVSVVEGPGDNLVPRPDLGNRITTYVTSETNLIHISFQEIASTWHLHSDKKPVWIESSNETLATLLSQTFECPMGRPDDWTEGIAEED